MKPKEFRYRRDWVIPSFLGTMLFVSLAIFLPLSFIHRSNIFDGGSFKEHYVAYIIMAAVTVIDAICWSYVFDNTTVLLINADGICIRGKLIAWDNIAAYRMVVYEARNAEETGSQHCLFDFADETPQLMLNLGDIDVGMHQIIKAITVSSTSPDIIFGGYEYRQEN